MRERSGKLKRQNSRQKALLATNFIKINNTLTCRSRNFRFSCVRAHGHVSFADTSAVFMAMVKRSGEQIIRIWSKQPVKQFFKSTSTFKNNIYRTVVFFQVL